LPQKGSEFPEKVHLLKVYKQTGKLPKKLAEQPECPDELKYIWDWFLGIIRGGEFTWANVQAWANLHAFRLTAWESSLLSKLHGIYCEINGRRYKPSSKG
jgi:hypothetical protein